MMSPRSPFSERNEVFGGKTARAFTLVELLVVAAVTGILLALALPSFVVLVPSRKSAIHELSGFLEGARSRAMASQSEMLVAFANGAFPGEGAYRSYALFVLEGEVDDPPEERPVRRLSPWKTLPPGMVFAHGEHFAVPEGTAFRTLFDVPAERSFPLPSALPGGAGGTVDLPCLHFASDGGICFPAFSDADALHLGVMEGRYRPKDRRPVPLSSGPGSRSAGRPANAECLGIGLYTGRSRLLTD